MHVDYDEVGAGLVCHLVGNLEHLSVDEFREEVAQLRANAHVIFDLSAVPFVDSAGLGALIGAIRHVRDLNGDVIVCAARPSVARVLDIVGLSRIVAVVEDLAKAKTLLLSVA